MEKRRSRGLLLNWWLVLWQSQASETILLIQILISFIRFWNDLGESGRRNFQVELWNRKLGLSYLIYGRGKGFNLIIVLELLKMRWRNLTGKETNLTILIFIWNRKIKKNRIWSESEDLVIIWKTEYSFQWRPFQKPDWIIDFHAKSDEFSLKMHYFRLEINQFSWRKFQKNFWQILLKSSSFVEKNPLIVLVLELIKIKLKKEVRSEFFCSLGISLQWKRACKFQIFRFSKCCFQESSLINPKNTWIWSCFLHHFCQLNFSTNLAQMTARLNKKFWESNLKSWTQQVNNSELQKTFFQHFFLHASTRIFSQFF